MFPGQRTRLLRRDWLFSLQKPSLFRASQVPSHSGHLKGWGTGKDRPPPHGPGRRGGGRHLGGRGVRQRRDPSAGPGGLHAAVESEPACVARGLVWAANRLGRGSGGETPRRRRRDQLYLALPGGLEAPREFRHSPVPRTGEGVPASVVSQASVKHAGNAIQKCSLTTAEERDQCVRPSNRVLRLRHRIVSHGLGWAFRWVPPRPPQFPFGVSAVLDGRNFLGTQGACGTFCTASALHSGSEQGAPESAPG